ncbi:MAG TPA: potassium transporter Kef [Polyangiaceae bacterium]
MNGLFVLMGLLALSYLGGALVNRRGGGAIGLPAGIEYVAVGFVLSPSILNVVERSMLDAFAPLVQVALGWLTLIIGLEFGQASGKNIEAKVVLAAVAGALLTIALTGGGAFALLSSFPAFFALDGKTSTWLLAAGIGVATCETTRHAVRWVMSKYRTDGPVTEMLHGFAATSDIVPLGALGLVLAFTDHAPMALGTFTLGPVERVALTVVIGALLGGIALVLVGKQVEGHAVWGALFGTALLGVGTAYRLGLSHLTVTFVEGLTIAALSSRRTELRKLLAPTERAVMLPTLFLAGTRLDFHVLGEHRGLVALLAFVLVARAIAKLASGSMLSTAAPDIRAAGGLGLGLLSAGSLSIAFGLTMAMSFPGTLGDTVLIAATLIGVVGEIFAPRALKKLLDRAGELEQARLSVTTVPPPAVEAKS